MNNQTWWGAVCDASNREHDPMFALNDKQWDFYRNMRDSAAGLCNNEVATYHMTKEEQVMYICFMAAFHDAL
jgi:hypothetical protein